MQRVTILFLIFSSIVLNAQEKAQSDSDAKKTKTSFEKEFESKELKKADIQKEVEKLRKLLMSEQNKK